MNKIIIIDYGMGNLGSIKNMLKYLGYESEISSDPVVIETADKLILPGVGAFDNGMTNIKQKGLLDVLNKKVLKAKTPVLGICLGMQLMTRSSEEGVLPGLGWIAADTKKFNFEKLNEKFRIPHMGWNTVKIAKKESIVSDLPENARFYFVHSYHAVCDKKEDELLITNYGYDFAAAFSHKNIIGMQFHPEKSHKFGMIIFKNFAEM